jgi:quercetin dioxygenase-like cupin family protein
MNIIKVKETAIIDTPHKPDVRRLYNKESAQAVHITLQPGESLKPHITPVDVFFYVLEGSPDIMVGNETMTVETDSLVESPKDIPHCISNKSDKMARVLVVKVPRPTTNARLL